MDNVGGVVVEAEVSNVDLRTRANREIKSSNRFRDDLIDSRRRGITVGQPEWPVHGHNGYAVVSASREELFDLFTIVIVKAGWDGGYFDF